MNMWISSSKALSVASSSVFRLLWMVMFSLSRPEGHWRDSFLERPEVFNSKCTCTCVSALLCHGHTLTSLWYLRVCWLTACQPSACTHMAGGWDIPARTLRAQTALSSPTAVAFTPGAPPRVQRFTRILCCLPTRSRRAAATRRYQRFANACLTPPALHNSVNSLWGVVT